jgi:hypothetical protein
MSPQEWCSLEKHPPYAVPLAAFAHLPEEELAHATGILYRPNIAHKIVIMRNADPQGRGKWFLTRIQRVEMPNVSPVFKLNIQRTVFAHNRTEVTFNKGVLADIRIEKGSELWGVATIPIAVAKTITDIPGQIIKFHIADTQAQGQLLQAQATLLTATMQYAQTVSGTSAAASGGRSGSFVGNCIDAHGSADECARLDTGFAQ